jgi:hypothetical protein
MWSAEDHQLNGSVENSEVEAMGLVRFDFHECVRLLESEWFPLAELDLTNV